MHYSLTINSLDIYILNCSRSSSSALILPSSTSLDYAELLDSEDWLMDPDRSSPDIYLAIFVFFFDFSGLKELYFYTGLELVAIEVPSNFLLNILYRPA
jgi:hypothetical protein